MPTPNRQPQIDQQPQTAPGMTAAPQAAAIACILLMLIAANLWAQRPKPRNHHNPAPTGLLIDINTADQPTLQLLPGIGPAASQRIIEHRQTHGPFQTIEQLDSVHRIGPKTIAAIRPYITLKNPQHAAPTNP